eukprot:2432260-Karenia_brevis.AAC.1
MDGLEAPVEKDYGWWEFKNKMFDEDKLPKRTLGPHQVNGGPVPCWEICAHGTPVEALYSIVSSMNDEGGGLRASEDESAGH